VNGRSIQVSSNETAYLSSQTLITPSSPGIIIAAFTSSLHPSNFDKRTGFFVVLNLSLLDDVAGFISAAIFLSLVIRFCREIEISLLHTHNFPPKAINIPKYIPWFTVAARIPIPFSSKEDKCMKCLKYITEQKLVTHGQTSDEIKISVINDVTPCGHAQIWKYGGEQDDRGITSTKLPGGYKQLHDTETVVWHQKNVKVMGQN